MKKLFTIDIHTHILPKDIPNFNKRFGYGEFVQLEHHKPCCAKMMMNDQFFREVESNCWDPEVRITECDHQDVDVQVLSTVPVMFSYWTSPRDGSDISKFINYDLIKVVDENPKRFVGLANVPMQNTDMAIKELERAKKLGFKGVQIGSHINNLNLDDPSFFPFYAACEELDMCIFVHPWCELIHLFYEAVHVVTLDDQNVVVDHNVHQK